jgi:hypothetical protein
VPKGLKGSAKTKLRFTFCRRAGQKVFKKNASALIFSKRLPYICVAFLKSALYGGYSSVG